MAPDNTCPICGVHLISTETSNCPQCDADLTCFAVLDSIPDEPPSVSEDGGRKADGGGQKTGGRRPLSVIRLPLMGAMLFLLGGLASWLLFVEVYTSEPPPRDVVRTFPVGIKIHVEDRSDSGAMDKSALNEPEYIPAPFIWMSFCFDPYEQRASLMEEGGKRIDIELVEAESAAETGDKPPGAEPDKTVEKVIQKAVEDKDEPDNIVKIELFTIYESAMDDTLWRISKKYYGSGLYFPVLMELNPGLGVYNLEKGMRLKVFKDAGRAESMYQEITRVDGNRVWYGYRVVKGDTFEGIAVKFYGPETAKERVIDLNPDARLQPGERIEVELE